jgi:ABC-type multidrug transport system fused ATPase/permease subunit
MVGRWFFALIGTIMSIIPAFVYWLAGYLAINHDPHPPTIGDIVAFTTLQSRLFFPLGQLLNVQVELQGALALFDRIFEYLDMEARDRRRSRRGRARSGGGRAGSVRFRTSGSATRRIRPRVRPRRRREEPLPDGCGRSPNTGGGRSLEAAEALPRRSARRSPSRPSTSRSSRASWSPSSDRRAPARRRPPT